MISPNAYLFTDLSSNNPDNSSTLPVYKADGHQLIVVKITEALSYVWSGGNSLSDEAHRLGLHVGHYHFARSSSSGAEQAAYFLGTTGAHHATGDYLILDLEVESQWAPGQANAFTAEFLGYLASHSPLQRVLYSGGYFAEDEHLTLPAGTLWWLADYSGTAHAPAGWEWWAWQYTSSAAIPGISGLADYSRLRAPLSVAQPVVTQPNAKVDEMFLMCSLALGKPTLFCVGGSKPVHLKTMVEVRSLIAEGAVVKRIPDSVHSQLCLEMV